MMSREIKEMVGTTEIEVSRGFCDDKNLISLVINQASSHRECHIIALNEEEATRIISALMYVRYN